MSIRRVRAADWFTAAAAAALFGVLFLEWFGLDQAGVRDQLDAGRVVVHSDGASGWSSLGWLALLLVDLTIFIGLATVLLTATRESTTGSVLAGVAGSAIGFLATIALLVQGVLQPDEDELASVEAGYWLGLALTIAVTVGSWWTLRDERAPAVPDPDVDVRPAPIGEEPA